MLSSDASGGDGTKGKLRAFLAALLVLSVVLL
jgi:hypothetical protein